MKTVDGDRLFIDMKLACDSPTFSRSIAKSLVQTAPAIDAVPVVRCGECAHLESDEEQTRHWCGRGQFGCGNVLLDGFCSWGEREIENG